jgi:hypothetical protein
VSARAPGCPADSAASGPSTAQGALVAGRCGNTARAGQGPSRVIPFPRASRRRRRGSSRGSATGSSGACVTLDVGPGRTYPVTPRFAPNLQRWTEAQVQSNQSICCIWSLRRFGDGPSACRKETILLLWLPGGRTDRRLGRGIEVVGLTESWRTVANLRTRLCCRAAAAAKRATPASGRGRQRRWPERGLPAPPCWSTNPARSKGHRGPPGEE